MSLTLDSLTKEMEYYHNQICILADSRLARLIGVAETDEDFYYITTDIKGVISYTSTVGWCIGLKDTCPKMHYERLDTIFEMNGSNKTKEFKVERTCNE